MIRRGLFVCCVCAGLVGAAGCGSNNDGGKTGPTDAGVGRVVALNSDYQASSVSFLDGSGNLVSDGCFGSATAGVGLTLTVSGDAVLPTQVPAGGPVIVVDRTNAVLTWLDPATCAPLRQLSVSTGFASQPHDVAVLSASKAYVTRAGDNATATPAPGDFDEGDDLLIIDPSAPAILGRIDLKPFAATDGVGILPQADSALVAEGRVYVSLNQISGDYKSYGTGRIVVVDPATDQVVAAVDLPGLKNCGAMTYVPADKKLFITCNGAYSDGPQQAASSAVVAIDVSTAAPTIVATISAADVGDLPFSFDSIAALAGGTILGVTQGNISALPGDRLWAMSLAGGKPSMVFESAEGFALSAVVADPSTGRVFLADGTMSKPSFLRTFDSTAAGFTAGPTVKTDPAGKLPPRSLAIY
jgi:hypothetical protein